MTGEMHKSETEWSQPGASQIGKVYSAAEYVRAKINGKV